MKNKKITADEEIESTVPGAILGTYDGECADSNITNLNGLDITREVWENVFKSDEYKKGIELGHYIGYLGHPADIDSQDYRKACIVMTEGHIADNGKVYGKFNLIDTPVGKIVKAFQDAGVIFGISVRGAGDIIQNSVDPETFVFRGFDLVTFPAFPKSIPKFTAIAASTDAEQRKKYQAVCAAVKTNLNSLDASAIDVVQACFAKQSDEYNELENRKMSLLKASDESAEATAEEIPEELEYITGETEEFLDPRVDTMTQLYLETKDLCDQLKQSNDELLAQIECMKKDDARRIASMERICTAQMNDLHNMIEAKSDEVSKLTKILASKNHTLERIQGSASSKSRQISDLTAKVDDLQHQLSKVQASLSIEQKHNRQLKEENLKYNKKVEAAQNSIEEKDTIICSLRADLNETVKKYAQEQKKAPNRDAKIANLQSKVEAAQTLVREYRDAYANLYANALGVRLPALSVTASTDIHSLQNMIRSSASIADESDVLEPTQDIDASDFDLDNYAEDDGDLVTL